VTLIDTSAWIEFLRDTGTTVCQRVDALLDEGTFTCHPIRMEVLAGAHNERHLRDLRSLLARSCLVATTPGDYEDAAALFRTCRRQGEAVRRPIDCLIAAHAIRAGIPVLHADADFEVLARHTAVQTVPL